MEIKRAVATALLAVACGLFVSSSSAPVAAATPAAPPAESVDVRAIAAAEIDRLEAAGHDTSTVRWVFTSEMDKDMLGWAEYPLNGVTTVHIEADAADWEIREDIPAAIRSIIRHEFGHVLTYAIGFASDAAEPEVRALFTDTLTNHADSPNPGFEAAAEAFSQALATEAGDTRTPFYVDTVSPESVAVAQGFLYR